MQRSAGWIIWRPTIRLDLRFIDAQAR